MSIRTRVTLYGLGIVALVLAAISALFLLLIAGSGQENQDKQLSARAAAAARSVQQAAAADLTAHPPLAAADLATSVEIAVLVLDDGGAVLRSTATIGGQPPALPPQLLAAAREHGTAAATVPAGGISLRVHVHRWQREDGSTGYAAAGQTFRQQQIDRQGGAAVVLVCGMVSLLVATVGIWLVAGRALRPLRQLTAMADEIGRSADLSRRLPEVRRRDDVGRLTASFNAMMGRLQEAYRRMAEALAAQQRFTADASHELRTPLTTMRSNAGFLRTHTDAAEDDRAAALADIEAEGARMSRLVDDLLTLARADGGQRLTGTLVNLGDLAQQVCRQARALHPDRTLHCAGIPVTVTGDEDALRRLLWILVDNAARHAPSGGNVWVAVTGHGPVAGLQVSDDGPGIAAHLHERVFDRFFRADESRNQGGAGLGLSIARWIVRAHGGEIVATSNDRGGASLVAQLPASPNS